MQRGAAIGLMLVVVGLAGCFEGAPVEAASEQTAERPAVFDRFDAQSAPEPQGASTTATTTLPAESVVATAPSMPNGTWYLAAVNAGPDAGLAAISWTVPAGARVPWALNDIFDEDRDVVVLEVALIFPEGSTATVDAWGFLGMKLDDEGAYGPAGGHLNYPGTGSVYGASIVIETSVSVGEPDADDVVFVSLGEIEEGSVQGILLMARASEAVEIGVAWRVLDHDPWDLDSEEEPAATPEAFIASRAAARPVAVATHASGRGFVQHSYLDVVFDGFPAGPGVGFEFVTGEPTYSWNVPPEARTLPGLHTLDASVVGSLAHGWDMVTASYFGWSTGASQVKLGITLHDEAAQAEGLNPEVYVPFAPVSVVASTGAFGMGDGDGASGAVLRLDRVTSANGAISSVDVGILEIGATLEELFGAPAAEYLGASASSPFWVSIGHDGYSRVYDDGARFTLASPGFRDLPRGFFETAVPAASS